MRILKLLVLGVVVVLVASACGADVDDPAEPIDGPWQLESGTVNGQAVPLVDGYRITFTGEGSTFGGTAACNQYGATFAIDGALLTLQELFVTEKACLPEVMDSEAAYLTGLQAVDQAVRSGDRLLLLGPDVELGYVALPPVAEQDLIGTIWILESLAEGDAVTTAPGDNLTLEFNDDRTFVALTGCRTLTGTYVVVGDEIATPELSAEGECTREFEAQDGHIVGVFEGPFTATIDGDRLTLTSAGNQGLGYRSDL